MLDEHANAVNDPVRLTVAFQGEPGAFSELAIRQQWSDEAIALPRHTFADAIAAVTDREADFAVIPVENAIAGPVQAALEALEAAAHRFQREGEVSVDVHLCLMAPPGATIESLRTIYSHPMALAQCRIFLARHAWLTPVPHADTAGAARDVAARGDHTVGAVAGAPAADRYGLTILARSIEDMPLNSTRFVIIRPA